MHMICGWVWLICHAYKLCNNLAEMAHRKEFWNSKASQEGDRLLYMVGEETDSEAREIHESDTRELIQHLPDLRGKDVLELASGVGRGVGRFTGQLAKRAQTVTSTDFMESFVEENRTTNGPAHNNITFTTLDATKLDYPPNSFDFVIGLWLLQFLSDEEIKEFLCKIIRVLRPGGYLFLRDSHFHPSSVLSRKSVGLLRTIKDYLLFYTTCSYSVDGSIYYLDLEYSFNSKTWVTLRGIPTVYNYRFRKSTREHSSSFVIPIKNHLTSLLYSEERVSVYSRVVDQGFVMPGGLISSRKFISSFDGLFGSSRLSSRSFRLLDHGSGLGGLGLAVLQAHTTVDVTFLEQSVFACEALTLTLKERQFNKGQIILAELLQLPRIYSFDCICSIHTLNYIEDKETCLKSLKQSLKEDGVLLLGVFSIGNKLTGKQLTELNECQNLYPLSPENYVKVLNDLRFETIIVEDLSGEYLTCIEKCIDTLNDDQEEALSTVVKDVIAKWTVLMNHLRENTLTWTHIIAHGI